MNRQVVFYCIVTEEGEERMDRKRGGRRRMRGQDR
jgi:hypothetical protein